MERYRDRRKREVKKGDGYIKNITFNKINKNKTRKTIFYTQLVALEIFEVSLVEGKQFYSVGCRESYNKR